METIVGWLSAFWGYVLDSFRWLLDGALYVLKAAAFFYVDGLLTTIYTIVGLLDVGTLVTNLAGLWGGLPPQLIYLINAVGLPPGLSMVFYAIVIRMLLNLIPAAVTRI